MFSFLNIKQGPFHKLRLVHTPGQHVLSVDSQENDGRGDLCLFPPKVCYQFFGLEGVRNKVIVPGPGRQLHPPIPVPRR